MSDPKDVPQCTAKAKSTGNRCKRRPIPGGTVCVKHGGKAPQTINAAARRLEERRALLALESFGIPRTVDPHAALLEELHRTAGAVDWLGAVVADIESNRIAWGRVKESSGEDSGSTTWAAGPNAYVKLWQDERDRLVRIARTCIDVGIEERRVRLAEAAGQQLAGVMRAVLDRLELTDEQRVLALVVVPEEFRRLGDASGQTVPGEVVAG